MKNLFIILIILGLCIQCKENNVDPKSIEIEARFGEPFTVVAVPAKVTFKEISVELYFESFAKDIEYGSASRHTLVTGFYKNGTRHLSFKIKHLKMSEMYEKEGSLNIILLNSDTNYFFETALIDSSYHLTFKKAYWEKPETVKNDGEMLKVDSAVFILKRRD